MSTFTTPDQFDGLRIYAGGRNYEFQGTTLEVEDDADAKRIRQFAIENPDYQLSEDGEIVVYRAPEPEEHGEIVADPADAGDGDGQDAPTGPQDDQDGSEPADESDTPPEDTEDPGDATDPDPDQEDTPEPAKPAKPTTRRRAK